LNATAEHGIPDEQDDRTLRRIRRRDLDGAWLRPFIDRLVRTALDIAAEDYAESDGNKGLSPDDIKEYRNYLELPEVYMLACLLALRSGLEWSRENETTHELESGSMLEDAARVAFDPVEYFGKRAALVDFMMENYGDAWYVFQDIAAHGEETARKRWNMPDERFETYAELSREVRTIVDSVVSRVVSEKRLTPDKAEALKHYPMFEIVADVMLEQFDIVRKQRQAEKKERQ